MRLHLSLRSKLYMGFLFVAMAGLFVGGFLVDRSVRSAVQNELQDRLTYETTMLGQMTANALFGELDPSDSSLNGGLRTLAESVHTEFAMITETGVVVADSESDDPRSLPSQLGAPEIVAARATGSGSAIRDGRLFVARAIQRDNRFLGYVRGSVPMGVIARQVRGVRLRLTYGALVALAVAVILGHALSFNGIIVMKDPSAFSHSVAEAQASAGDARVAEADLLNLASARNDLKTRLQAVLGEGAEGRLDIDDREREELLTAVANGLPRREIVRQLADWRLERAESKLNRFAAQARELGARLGKGEIDVVVRADGLRLSRDALAPFSSSFAHVIRNAVDHGIDYPEERARSRKRERPLLTLTASRAGDVVVIEVIDDGHGVDWEAVRRVARRLGLPHENHQDLINALFHDGFSTKGSVSEVSGRGIGLGVARAECERLGGIVTVTSEGGQGTAFRFHFPSQKVANSPSSPPERAEPGTADKASPPPPHSSSFSSAAEAESFVPRNQKGS